MVEEIKKNNMKELFYKDHEDVEMFEKKTISTRVDEQGRTIKTFKWVKMTKPLSLGSINNPKNEDFLGFEVREKKKESEMQRMMGGLFGGGK